MKSTFKIGNIEINGVKVENIEFTQEYSVSEAISMVNFGKKFMTELLDESPALLESLERAFNKFNEIDDRVDEGQKLKRKSLMADFNGMYNHTMGEMHKIIMIQKSTREPLTATLECKLNISNKILECQDIGYACVAEGAMAKRNLDEAMSMLMTRQSNIK